MTLFVRELDVQSVALLCPFTGVTSFSFTMMIQVFAAWLDNPCRFVMLLLLIYFLRERDVRDSETSMKSAPVQAHA